MVKRSSNHARTLLLAAAYAISGWLSFQIAVSHQIVTMVMFAAEGIALAAAALGGPSLWPGILIGQFVLAVVRGVPLPLAFGIGAISALGYVLAAVCIRRLSIRPALPTSRDLLLLFALSFTILQPLSATAGVTLLCATGHMKWAVFGVNWLSWWFGNTLGQVVITPAILALVTSHVAIGPKSREAIATGTFAAVVAWTVCQSSDLKGTSLAFAVSIPLVVTLASRASLGAVAAANVLFAVVVIFESSRGVGPFVTHGALNLVDLNLFLLGTSMASTLVAAIVRERAGARVELERFVHVVDSHVITATVGLDGRVLSVSAALCDTTGLVAGDMVGRLFADHWHGRTDSPGALDLGALTTLHARWEGELLFEAYGGRAAWVNAHVHPVLDQAGVAVAYTVIAHDITARRLAELCANEDCLTGISSRRRLNDELAHQVASSERHDLPLSVVMFDIDHFKVINDTIGHAGGDQVLVRMAASAKSQIRASDYLGRWGGEEFLAICPSTPLEGACELAERLRLAVSADAYEHIGQQTCSFGVAQYLPGDTPESLIVRADAALYRAKRSGRNRVEAERPDAPVAMLSAA